MLDSFEKLVVRLLKHDAIFAPFRFPYITKLYALTEIHYHYFKVSFRQLVEMTEEILTT